jgi:hypothetical protein
VHSNLVAGRIVVFGFRIDFNDSAIGEKCHACRRQPRDQARSGADRPLDCSSCFVRMPRDRDLALRPERLLSWRFPFEV